MKNIMVVFGTRPEAIKMCPLIKTLKKEKSFNVVVCVTGQHKEMLKQVLDAFQIEPDYDLEIMKENQDLFTITSDILDKLQPVIKLENPDIMLVHGDTTTTFATALASFYLQIPVGHVEAGLRTYDIYSPFPEEFNRQAVGNIATYNFCPTETSKRNLIKENKNENSIVVTGNTAIDALKTTVVDNYFHDLFDWVGDNKLIMLTVHRRENLGVPMRNMFRAINRVCEENSEVRVVYPIHLNPKIREIANEELKNNKQIKIVNPFEVVDFHNFLARSYMILTDSGGIQEEAPSLGKPVLVLRDTTERPEGIEAGTLKLVGQDEDKIYHAFSELLNNKELYNEMSQANNPYGDGHASEKIRDFLLSKL